MWLEYPTSLNLTSDAGERDLSLARNITASNLTMYWLGYHKCHPDRDGDGYGSRNEYVWTLGECENGYVLDGTDCNDGNPNVNPGTKDICNGIDDNCDGVVDGSACWSMIGRDSKHTGFTPYTSLILSDYHCVSPMWTFHLGGRPYASPIIGHKIYIGTHKTEEDNVGKFYAINFDGTKYWSFHPDNVDYWTTAALTRDQYGHDIIYVVGGKHNPSTTAILFAIDKDGNEMWNHTLGAWIGSPPVIGPDGTIYAEAAYKVWAFYPNGTEKWEHIGFGHWDVNAPAIGDDGTLYVTSNDHNLYAIDPNSGNITWRFRTGGAIYNPAVIGSDGTIYIGSADRNLYAITPDGYKKWNFTTDGWIIASPAIGPDGTIYAFPYTGHLYAINPDGTKKWDWIYGLAWSTSQPVVDPYGTVYISRGDVIYRFPRNSDKTYNITFDGHVLASGITESMKQNWMKGRYDTTGALIALKPDKNITNLNKRVKWRFRMGGVVYTNSPAIYGFTSRIIMVSQNGYLYMLKPQGPSCDYPIYHVYWQDEDNDTYGNKWIPAVSTTQPEGYVTNYDDPDDMNASIVPTSGSKVTTKDNSDTIDINKVNTEKTSTTQLDNYMKGLKGYCSPKATACSL